MSYVIHYQGLFGGYPASCLPSFLSSTRNTLTFNELSAELGPSLQELAWLPSFYSIDQGVNISGILGHS
jgi:hypothetical protein